MESDPFRRNERGCRCPADPESGAYRSPAVPDGYCGRCEVCGRPGHDRFFPGILPFRGTWCDRHYRRIGRIHPCGAAGIVVWSALGWVVLLALLSWGIAA